MRRVTCFFEYTIRFFIILHTSCLSKALINNSRQLVDYITIYRHCNCVCNLTYINLLNINMHKIFAELTWQYPLLISFFYISELS